MHRAQGGSQGRDSTATGPPPEEGLVGGRAWVRKKTPE